MASALKHEVVAAVAACAGDYQLQPEVVTRWRTPLVGVAAASDPMFGQLRELIRPSHALPTDLLAGARSVIVFFLPFEPRVGASNRKGRLSSEAWARAYLETNRLIGEICAHLGELLEARGHRVCATPATHNFDAVELVSDWSHRHVAWIAGLGTFGVNNMLITERGCCGRLGSLVTSAAIEADPRPAQERCLYKRDGSCLECVDRCVSEALTAEKFDRHRCYDMLRENERAHESLGKADVCGKCVVKLPCSHSAPRPASKG